MSDMEERKRSTRDPPPSTVVTFCPSSSSLVHQLSSSILDYPLSDEPIDMSLKSRKRARSSSPIPIRNDRNEKKLFGKNEGLEKEVLEKKRKMAISSTEKKYRKRRSLMGRRQKPLPDLIVSPEDYSLQGIESHFARSLRNYRPRTLAEKQVEEHFIRSLGWEVWSKVISH